MLQSREAALVKDNPLARNNPLLIKEAMACKKKFSDWFPALNYNTYSSQYLFDTLVSLLSEKDLQLTELLDQRIKEWEDAFYSLPLNFTFGSAYIIGVSFDDRLFALGMEAAGGFAAAATGASASAAAEMNALHPLADPPFVGSTYSAKEEIWDSGVDEMPAGMEDTIEKKKEDGYSLQVLGWHTP